MIMRIVHFFLDGPFSVMLIVASLFLGSIALVVTPREEIGRASCRERV